MSSGRNCSDDAPSADRTGINIRAAIIGRSNDQNLWMILGEAT